MSTPSATKPFGPGLGCVCVCRSKGHPKVPKPAPAKSPNLVVTVVSAGFQLTQTPGVVSVVCLASLSKPALDLDFKAFKTLAVRKEKPEGGA